MPADELWEEELLREFELRVMDEVATRVEREQALAGRKNAVSRGASPPFAGRSLHSTTLCPARPADKRLAGPLESAAIEELSERPCRGWPTLTT